MNKVPKIMLSHESKKEIFYNALCNGLSYMGGYGLELTFSKYNEAKKSLLEKNSKDICFEDVLMEILEIGGNLTMVDHDSDGDLTRSITMEDMLKNMDIACEKYMQEIVDMLNENDDANTADILLQIVFFEDVIFG